jgi:hypothetical protein
LRRGDGFFLRGVGTTKITPTNASSINSLGLVCGTAGTAVIIGHEECSDPLAGGVAESAGDER